MAEPTVSRARSTADPRTPSLARTSAVMAGGTVVSRILGMVRTTVQAGVVGLTLTGDTWDVANSLPNLLYLLLAGGVLNAVLVPQIIRASSHADGGRDFVDRLLTLAITAMAAVTVVVTLGAALLVRLYSDNFPPQAVNLSTAFAFICLPQVFFYGLYTLLGQVLNARGQFAAYMWAPVLANVLAIAGMVTFIARGYPTKAPPQVWTAGMVWLLAGSATAGIVAQALVLIVPLHRAGFRYRPRWGFRGVGLRTASTVAGWTFAALGVSQLGFVVTSRVLTGAQSMAAHGQVVPGKASYSNAFLLFMLPHSLVTVSLVTALFTRMSRAASTGDLGEVRADLSRGMRLTAVATVPCTIGIVVLGSPLTSVLFFRNSAAEAHGVYLVTLAMMSGLVPFGTLYLLQRVFYAFEDARTPFLLQLVVTGIATAGNLVAAALPAQWTGVGVGLAQAVSNLVGAAAGLVLVRRRLSGLPLLAVAGVYVRLFAAALGAAAATTPVVWGVRSVVGDGRLAALVALVLGGSVFAACYLLLAGALQVRELTDLTAPFVGRAWRLLSQRSRPRMNRRIETTRPQPGADDRRPTTKEPTVQGVGQGSVLGDRYVLSRRSARGPEHEMWLAHDQTLERPVAVILLDAAHPGADAALDAGRRAAAIEDQRLVRIFDVGEQDGVAYIVQEALIGAVSLSSLVGQGGLPADEVRRIVGEAATALDGASARGLHHQRLTPVTVGRLRDGSVVVTGLAVLAALAGDDGLTPAAASRVDAVALAALTYAGLTGRWPLSSVPAHGLQAAPTLGARLAAPSEVAAGVPADLDRLCRATLIDDGGPRTPGEVAAHVGPWRSRTHWRPPDQTERLPRPGTPDETEIRPQSSVTPASTVRMAAPTVRIAAPSSAGGADPAQDTIPEVDPAHVARTQDRGRAATKTVAGAVSTVGSALTGTRAAAGTVGGRVGSLARAAAQQASAARATRIEQEGPRVSLPEVLLGPAEPEEPVAPLIGTTQAGRPSKDQTRTVLAVLALFVVGALTLSYCNLSRFPPGSSARSKAAASSTQGGAASPSSSAGPSSSPSSSPSSGPVVVKSARGFDPAGDGREMNAYASRAFDGNPASAWTTEGYSSARFGGLSKRGVGLLLDLGRPTTVHEADLTLPLGPTDVTLYATSDRGSIQGATELGHRKDVVGSVHFTAPADAPSTRYVVVWFTKLVSSGGKYRAALAEISLR